MFKNLLLVLTVVAVLFSVFPLTAQAYQDEDNTPTLVSTPTTPSTAALTDPDVGPDEFPAGINPLTGLPVADPNNLLLPPALISITNFPVSARPQAGLSFSPVVFEMYVGEGMSRFLAVFYGDYPQAAVDNENASKNLTAGIGPIRSGRLPYESLRKLYNGFLVMASAYKSVAANLSQTTNVFGSDANDINSAMIDSTKLAQIAQSQQNKLSARALSGQRFVAAAPPGGKDAQALWMPWSYLNQVFWRYNPETGAYHRFQDQADATTFVEFTDRLNGEALTYENVVVLFADHHAEYETIIDIDLAYQHKNPALLLRDGKMYEIFWTTRNEEYERTTGKVRPIRLIDADGEPFPLKPGQTWMMLAPRYSRYNETVYSELYADLKSKTQPGSGIWVVHFYAPKVGQ
jgi:hypothetical protein